HRFPPLCVEKSAREDVQDGRRTVHHTASMLKRELCSIRAEVATKSPHQGKLSAIPCMLRMIFCSFGRIGSTVGQGRHPTRARNSASTIAVAPHTSASAIRNVGTAIS